MLTQHAFCASLPAAAVHTAAVRELRHVDGDVDADQRARDPGADPLEARTPHAVRDSLDTLLPAGMLRTADADRRHRHALRADRAAALGARQPGDAVRMAVTGPFDGFSHVRSSVVGCPSTSPSRPAR